MTGARRKIVATVLLGAVWGILWDTASARTFHVSPFGSNTPPYDTYDKAAHNIQDAVDQTEAGDTVRIGAGVYRPDTTVLLRDSIVVFGAGRDSSVIIPDPVFSPRDGRPNFYRILELRRPHGVGMGLSFSGCAVRGYEGPGTPNAGYQYGLHISGPAPGTKNHVFDNAFFFLEAGITMFNAAVEVKANYFDSCGSGIMIDYAGPFDIHHNTFVAGRPSDNGVYGSGFPLLGPARIHHNVAWMRDYYAFTPTSFGDSVVIENNLLLSQAFTPLFAYCDCAGAIVRNNTVVRALPDPGMEIAWFSGEGGSSVVVENNVFIGQDGYLHFTTVGDTTRFAYNALWGLTGQPGTGRIYAVEYGAEIDSSGGNLYVNPMFAVDSVYRLQRGSPLIDAGDPTASDSDGSRSDIGWQGGPGGTTYIYPELPPQTPDSVRGDDTACFRLSWQRNSEADLGGYRVYRSGQSGFTPSGANLRAEIPDTDTTFTDSLDGTSLPLYYTVTAIDTAGLESDPSLEIAWLRSGICDTGDGDVPIPNTPAILRLYPNPFNAALTVEYFVPDVGDPSISPRLTVLNVLGQQVADLKIAGRGRGSRSVTWDGKDSDRNSAPSGVYFVQLSYAGLHVLRQVALVR